MAKLYELTEAFRKFNQLVEDALDNVDNLEEDDLQMFVDTIESINDSIENKVENIVKFMKNIESDIEGFKKEEKRLYTRRKYLENKYEGLKNYMAGQLTLAKLKQVNAGSFKVKFQNSPASVEVLNENDVPSIYREAQPDKINKKDLLKDLKDGKQIAGVLLIDDKQHLRIT